MTVTIQSRRTVQQEPFFVALENAPSGVCAAVTADGRRFPAQNAEGGVIVIADVARDVPLELELVCGEPNGGVALEQDAAAKALKVLINGQLFTQYVYDDAFMKPYLGPVYTSAGNGESFTRLDLVTQEHPHQRSVFVAVGDVNGVDFWNEKGGAHHGREVAGVPQVLANGAAYARFTAQNIWTSDEDKPFLQEQRTFTFYNQSAACRTVDLEIVFTAAYGDVQFGPTKEAGPLGIRMNEELRADRGGFFCNAYGAEKEAECWGRSAPWCDYSGILNGRRVGIAVFDHEDNERYPTAWHIRNYGLFAANNLFFKGGLTIPNGESLTYRFRLCFYEHELDTAARYLVWAR